MKSKPALKTLSFVKHKADRFYPTVKFTSTTITKKLIENKFFHSFDLFSAVADFMFGFYKMFDQKLATW